MQEHFWMHQNWTFIAITFINWKIQRHNYISDSAVDCFCLEIFRFKYINGFVETRTLFVVLCEEKNRFLTILLSFKYFVNFWSIFHTFANSWKCTVEHIYLLPSLSHFQLQTTIKLQLNCTTHITHSQEYVGFALFK